MTEKIKVSIPQETSELLKKDCADFKITKANDTPNMNAFINTLLVNFYEEFAGIEEKMHDNIRAAIANVPEYYRENAFSALVKVFAQKQDTQDGSSRSVVLSFKPSKNAEKVVVFLEKVLLQNESLSSFYRRLFLAYARKTKNEREKIIHKDNYQLLCKAIKKQVGVCLLLRSGDILKTASIHSICGAKDELFNYILLYNGKNNMTVRLSSVRSVSLLPSKSYIPIENSTLFDRQAACAPQYPMYSTDTDPIRVQLTEKGKKLFEKIYLYRPVPTSIEGDIYTFHCSANQALQYFERFGDSALILSPKKLGIFMRNYYYFSFKKYKELYPRN